MFACMPIFLEVLRLGYLKNHLLPYGYLAAEIITRSLILGAPIICDGQGCLVLFFGGGGLLAHLVPYLVFFSYIKTIVFSWAFNGFYIATVQNCCLNSLSIVLNICSKPPSKSLSLLSFYQCKRWRERQYYNSCLCLSVSPPFYFPTLHSE